MIQPRDFRYSTASALVVASKISRRHLEKAGTLAQQLIQPCDDKSLEACLHSQSGEDEGGFQQELLVACKLKYKTSYAFVRQKK